MKWLLDANVLIALVNVSHVGHDRARRWFVALRPAFATCPITQGALVRHYFRDATGADGGGALRLIAGIEAMDDHEFWPDDASYGEIDYRGVLGHRQVTDAYLAGLARKHGARLATMDVALAALHDDVAELLPT
jgi:toxin-antitoxin system PIN domain toxin